MKGTDGKTGRSVGGAGRAILLGSLPPLLVLVVWHVSASRSSVIPTVGEVAGVLAHPFAEPRIDSLSLGYSALVSLLRVTIGFSLAALTAIPLGIGVGRVRPVRELFSPVIEMARPICPVAWLPLLIVLFGSASVGSLAFGDRAWRHDLLDQLGLAMVAVIWWGAFFPIFINTAHAVAHVKELHLEVAATCGASRFQAFRHVVLPAALPAVVAGLRIGMGTAWMVIVAAEFFPGTRAGLAYMITNAFETGKHEYTFASILVIGLIGILINACLRRLERRVGHWQARER